MMQHHEFLAILRSSTATRRQLSQALVTRRRERGVRFNRHGVVLIAAYGVVASLMILQAAYFSRIAADQQLATRQIYRLKALHYADAGVDQALVSLYDNQTYAGTGGTETFGEGAYSITVADHPDNPTLKVVDVTGYFPDPSVSASAESTSVQALIYFDDDLFSWGFFGDEGISMPGSVNIDGYDSDNGPYSATNRNLAPADVGTNSTSAGAVTVGPNFRGSNSTLYCGVGCNTATGVSTHVNSVYLAKDALDEPVEFPAINVPTAPYAASNLTITGNVTISRATFDSYGYGGALNGGGALVTDDTDEFMSRVFKPYPNSLPNTYAIVVNDLSISGGATVSVGADIGELLIYVRGSSLGLGGGAVMGATTTHKATQLTVYADAASCTFSSVGGLTFVGALYLPNCTAATSGNVTFYGAVVANRYSMTGTVNMRYDQALDTTNGKAQDNFEIRAWLRQ